MTIKASNLLFFLFISFFSHSQIIPSDRDYQWESFGLQDTSTVNFNNIDLSNYPLHSSGIISNDSLFSSIITTFSSGGASGTILNFPSGSFLFNQTISLPGNIVLKGRGADSTILKFDLNGVGNAIEVVGSASSDTSNLLQNALSNLNKSLILDLHSHYSNPTVNNAPNKDNPLLEEMSRLSEATGSHNPMRQIYITR